MISIFFDIIKRIFKEYPPRIFSFAGDEVGFTLELIGDSLIALTFTIFGIICIIMSGIDTNKTAHNERKILSKLVGIFLLIFGISKIFSEISFWHNYAFVESFLRFSTGIISLIVLCLTPKIITKMNEARTITDLDEHIRQAKETLEDVKNKLNDTSSS